MGSLIQIHLRTAARTKSKRRQFSFDAEHQNVSPQFELARASHLYGRRPSRAPLLHRALFPTADGAQGDHRAPREAGRHHHGADGARVHPVADRGVLGPRPQDRARRAQEDGQGLHQRGERGGLRFHRESKKAFTVQSS